jgi:L-threonylcarbamoyladenylate synthase
MNNSLQNAVKVLNNGGIIIYPTDTTFGIGCRIDNNHAIEKLFSLRNRPLDMAVPVLVGSLGMAKTYGKISEEVVSKLVNPFWPGALTIVVKSLNNIPDLVSGGKNTVGIRIPNNNDILHVINNVGVPILGPSANFHGFNTPYKFEDLDPKLTAMVDYVLNGECNLKQPSTVIDTTQNPWKILREGAVKVRIE